ncbi:MAG: segregation/condensation protein A [Patescibacteria group bacterium]
MYKIKIEQFEGPLDLLLQLIEEQKLEITEVSLSTVTEQYIAILDQNTSIPAEELADFLVVAAKLLLIKSKALLPYLSPDEEDLGAELESQLKMYKLFYEASKVIHKMILKKRFCFYRDTSRLVIPVFIPPEKITAADLGGFFHVILKNIEPIIEIPKKALCRTISIREKISQIRDFIFQNEGLNFKKLIAKAKNRTEIIVTFLALLELVKQRDIAVCQDNIFSEITINKINLETP